MYKDDSMKQMAQKVLFCITNISSEIYMQIFAYSFSDEGHILHAFLPNAVTIKSIKNDLHKVTLLWCLKCL